MFRQIIGDVVFPVDMETQYGSMPLKASRVIAFIIDHSCQQNKELWRTISGASCQFNIPLLVLESTSSSNEIRAHSTGKLMCAKIQQ